VVSACLVGTDGSKKSFILNFVNSDIFYKENEPLFANLYKDNSLRVCAKTAASESAIFEKAYANPKIANAFFKKNIKFRSLGASLYRLYTLKTHFLHSLSVNCEFLI